MSNGGSMGAHYPPPPNAATPHYPPPPGAPPAPPPHVVAPPPQAPAPDPELIQRSRRRARFFWDHLFPYMALLLSLTVIIAIIETHLPQDLLRLRFLNRWAFLLLLAVPLLCFVGFHTEGRRQGSFVFSRLRDLVSAGPGLLGRFRKVPAVLRILSLTLFIIALSRPQSSLTITHEEKVEGIDIMIALDVSLSMQANDLSGGYFGGKTRLDVAKEVIDDFIRRRKHDRIGLVIFGKDAYSWCPPTLDYHALRTLLADVRLGVINGRATAIGDALGTSINRLRRSKATSKVIILLTDGENNSGMITPNQAANFAATFKIKIYTILMGRHAGRGLWGRRFRVNPRLLEEIAALTGGTPYLATDKEALKERFQRILDALKKDVRVRKERLPSEHYRAFLVPGMIVLLLELLLSLVFIRRFP